MATPELRVVRGPAPVARGSARRGAALVPGLVVLVAAGIGTWRQADRARLKVEVRERAEAAIETALERGSADPDVRATLVELRRTLGWRPLESKTRVIYASLVLGLATSGEDMRLAAFHARRAAELAPVTVSVVRAAALVLAHTGDRERALELVRAMFGYDPPRAAATLAQIESLVLGVQPERAIPDTPEAWMAWAHRRAQDGRPAEAGQWIARTWTRWPQHLPARVALAGEAFARRDWEALTTLAAPHAALPADPAAAPLHAYRAHLQLARGERAAAVNDAEAALGLAPGGQVRALAGDVFEATGDVARARHEWSSALHEAGPGAVADRWALLSRLARLEDAHGRPAAALRHWQALLDLDPRNVEARRRVDDLAGFER